MLLRMKVLVGKCGFEKGKTFQATGSADPGDGPSDEVRSESRRHLEAGAVTTRFYRGGQPHGKCRRRPPDRGRSVGQAPDPHEAIAEIWKLVETGAVNTVEIQPLPPGSGRVPEIRGRDLPDAGRL